MRVVQRSGKRVAAALLRRRLGDPRLAHHDEAGKPSGVRQQPDARISLAA